MGKLRTFDFQLIGLFMRQPLVAGNWKLNGSLESVEMLLSGITDRFSMVRNAEVAVCPPFIYLEHVRRLLQDVNIELGAQDCSDQQKGAYTGEVSASMIREFGCKYIIVGHSERRHLYAESDATVAMKFERVRENDLTPILCVGETLQDRGSGHTETVIARQLDAVLERSGIEGFSHAVIAYEPVWAIGTGKTATPGQAQQVHAFVRGRLEVLDKEIAAHIRILYGGSMKPDNAGSLLQENDIDGGLIGGAALKAEDFITIAAAGN